MEQYKGDIYAILTAVAWSAAVIYFKLSRGRLRTVPLKVFQNTVATFLFFLSIALLGESWWLDLSSRQWAILALSAVLGISVGDTLFIAAIHRIGASRQAIVDGLYMPIVMGLAFLFFGEVVSYRVLLGAAFVVAAIILSHMDTSGPQVPKKRLLTGLGLAVLSQFSMAVCVVIMKDILHQHSLLTITAYRFLIGAFVLVCVYSWREKPSELWAGFRPGRAWSITLPGAVLGPFLATLFWFAGFKYTLAGKAAVYNQLSTVLIVILASIFLNESLTRHKLAAIGVAMFGCYLVLSG